MAENTQDRSGLLKKIGSAIWKKFWGKKKGFKDIKAAADSQKKKLKIMKEIDK